MLENKNSFVRTRGLVLIAENAIWDEKGIIDRFLTAICSILRMKNRLPQDSA